MAEVRTYKKIENGAVSHFRATEAYAKLHGLELVDDVERVFRRAPERAEAIAQKQKEGVQAVEKAAESVEGEVGVVGAKVAKAAK
jgi:hypothetical protein